MRWVVVAAALVLAACGGDDDSDATTTQAPTTVATTIPTTIPTTVASTTIPVTTAAAAVPDAVVPEGFDQVAATVTAADGTVCELCLWLAANGDQRALGLMYVTDLGGPDGMIFRYPSPTSGAFWMKNTVMPLSIAFYDQSGTYLDAFDMAPCDADLCPSYPTPSGFVDAIEVSQGMLDELSMTPGSTLTVTDLPCDGV